MARIGTGNIRVGSAIAHGTGKKYEIYNTSPRPEPSMDTAVPAPSAVTEKIPPRPAQGESYGMDSPIMQERNKFEQFLIQKHDVPINIGRKEINQETVKRAAESERELFEGTFGGQFRYEDRNSLPFQLKAAWGQAKLSARKQIQDQLIEGVKEQIDAHKERMKIFDKQLSKLPVGYELWEQDPERYKQFKEAGRQEAELTPYQNLALKKDLIGTEKELLTQAQALKETSNDAIDTLVSDMQLSIDFFNEHTDKNYRYVLDHKQETKDPWYRGAYTKDTYTLKKVPKSKESKGKEVKKQTMTDEEITNILRGKYAITPENIEIFRKNNGL